MGIFYNTYIYDGILVKKLDTEINKDFSVNVKFMNGTIYHKPKKFLQIASMDPVLEQHEILSNKVNKNEIENLLQKKFKEYINQFDYNSGNVFICQTMVTTYDFPFEENIQYNININ